MSVIENTLERMRRGPGVPKSHSEPVVASAMGSAPMRLAPLRILVDEPKLRTAGYLPQEGEERRFADYYRAIKRPIIQKALLPQAATDLRLILVSSALPGEGKTFTALNLAFSMAREHDISVLLVDGDIPKAHISRAFGVQQDKGLVDALREETLDVESLVLRTNLPSLSVLPAGGPVEGAAELVASERMGRVAAQLLQRHPRRLVLFDSSPLLVSSEARALVQIPGQVVLVARSGHTPRQALLDAVGLIDKKRLNGLVLNDAAARDSSDSYYGYGYYGNGKPDS